MASSKAETFIIDAISKVETLCPITGFDYSELSKKLIEELKSHGLTIAPITLTAEMFAAGLAAHKPSLPHSIMATYNAEIAAWNAEG